MKTPLRLAIAGCGRITELGYAPALRQVPELRVCAVADPDRSRRERLARDCGTEARSFASVAAMVDAVAPDAVVVASPPALHLEHAELASAAGACVLVEKPPGLGREEAIRLAGLPRPAWVGFNRRFSHLRTLAGRLPAAGELRLSLRISYRRASWRPHEVSDDALADLGPHLADLAGCLLGGELASARATALSARRARAELRGPRGRAELVCETDAPWAERIEVRDGAGRLAARSVHGGVVRGVAHRLRRGEHPLVDPLARQLRLFASAAGGGDAGALASAADGARAMSALDATRRSAESGGGVVPV